MKFPNTTILMIMMEQYDENSDNRDYVFEFMEQMPSNVNNGYNIGTKKAAYLLSQLFSS